jgi:hypothetical protein
VVNSGTTVTFTTTPHGLGYAPLIDASINNTTISGIGSNLNQPLPTWLAADIGGTTPGVVSFNIYLSAVVDATNVYFLMLNATGNPKTITVTYYLYQQRQQT